MNLLKLNQEWNRYFAGHSDTALQKRAYNLINLTRLALSLIFAFSSWYIGNENWWDRENAQFFFDIALAYLVFSVVVFAVYPLKLPTPFAPVAALFFPVQIVADIVFITLLMHAAGGVQSGLGLLLIITIVSASLVSNGRLALFYAAIASIGLLLEQSYQIFKWDLATVSYTQSVMLSLSCFATAWLAFSLAKRMQYSEELASARSIDLANLGQVNELITREMQDGVLVVDQDSNIRHYNLQAESLLALSKKTTESMTLASLAPEIAKVFGKWINNPVDNNVLISSNNRELKLRFMPINELREVGAVIFIQDWSQLQTVAQQAKLAALGRLTANIAHEIRNPLSAISHANQLLQEEEHISAPTARILQIIADNIQRIDQIIKDVLELNRRDRTHQEKIDVHQFLDDFHTHFCAVEKIPDANINLAISRQKQLYTNFDRRHLNQILWNLCKNGWEHSQKKPGSLVIQCQEAGTMALNIHVCDDGDGVLAQDRARLFEPFFTTKHTGNGLGLYISRELAAANGAILHYHANDADDKPGSIFTLQLKKA